MTSRHSDAQGWASECSDVKNYKLWLNPVWHRMLYSCTHMATHNSVYQMVNLRSTRASQWSPPVFQQRSCLRSSWHLFHLAFRQRGRTGRNIVLGPEPKGVVAWLSVSHHHSACGAVILFLHTIRKFNVHWNADCHLVDKLVYHT